MLRQIFGALRKEGDEIAKDNFIYFWDDVQVDDKEAVLGLEAVSKESTFRTYQMAIGTFVSLILAPLPYFFFNSGQDAIGIIALILLIFTILINYIFNNNRFAKNLHLIRLKSDRMKDFNFSAGDEFIFDASEDKSVENLNKFRIGMVDFVKTINRTTRDITFQLSTIEARFSRTSSGLGLANMAFEQSLSNSGSYQEFRRYISLSSSGIDSLTSAFDESIQVVDESNKLLRSIGKQTQMLALNAGIEASRSGDFGIGFEVVASNLRRLSNHILNSATASKEQISEISKNAKVSLELISTSMHQIREKLNQTYDVFNSIQSDVESSSRDFNSVQSIYDELLGSVKDIESELSKFTV